MQVYQVFEASIGSSLELNKLMVGFNDTTVTDFLNVHGASLSPLLGQLRYVILAYFIFSIFINAGLLNAVAEERSGWDVFWEGGKKYFFRFLGVSLFFIILFLLWTGLTLIPYINWMQPSIEVFSSEKTTVFLLFVILFFWLLGVIYLFNASVIARLKIIKDELKNWKAIKKGMGISFRRFFSFTGLFLLFFLLQIIFIAFYWQTESMVGMTSPLLVFIFFIIQQIMVFIRWIFRLGMYAGVKKLLGY